MLRNHENDNYYGGNFLRNAWSATDILKFLSDIKDGAPLVGTNFEVVNDDAWKNNTIPEDSIELVRKYFDKVDIFLIEISANRGSLEEMTEEHLQKCVESIKDFIGPKLIVWQCHFRPHVYAPGYTDRDLAVCPWHEPLPARERIYNVLKKEKYFLDPSEKVKEWGHEKVLWDIDWHWNVIGYTMWSKFLFSKLEEWELVKADYI